MHQPNPQIYQYRQKAEKQEEALLHPKAAFSKNHSRFNETELDHRLPYKRDVDRIVHSKAYARYADKTQVVYLVDNDHVTHRALHVQLVSNFARGVAEILCLNLDLVEAIALGHDVGHPPFGHEGEQYLSKISEHSCQTPFAHPWQSCRLLSEIEPLNLGLDIYDGFLCHDGGSSDIQLIPLYGKTWDIHFAEKALKLANPDANITPGTLEGCLVKLCDTMSYLGKDIEDAIQLGLLNREEVPHTILGTSNKEILTVLACDLIENSYGKEYISMSHKCYEALCTLRKFNFKKIYVHPKLKIESKKIERSYQILFQSILDDYLVNDQQSHIWKQFLWNRRESYLKSTPPTRMVIDYIAGMTDNYFVKTLEKFILPARIDLNKECPTQQPA